MPGAPITNQFKSVTSALSVSVKSVTETLEESALRAVGAGTRTCRAGGALPAGAAGGSGRHQVASSAASDVPGGTALLLPHLAGGLAL